MPQTENLRRAALVTGGAKGIGRAICRALAENGMNIAVNYAAAQPRPRKQRLPAVPLVCRPSRCKRMCAALKPAKIWWKIPLPLLGGSMCWSTTRALPPTNCFCG